MPWTEEDQNKLTRILREHSQIREVLFTLDADYPNRERLTRLRNRMAHTAAAMLLTRAGFEQENDKCKSPKRRLPR